MSGDRYVHALKLDNGVPVAEISGLLAVVDTGSPASFGAVGALAIQSREFPLASQYLGVDVGAINRHLQSPVAALIGTDILREFVVTFDLGTNTLVFEAGRLTPPEAVEVTDVMGVPVVPARLDGVDHSMIVDTGAALSYLVAPPTGADAALGETMDDFLPMFGKFRTELFQAHLTAGRSAGIRRFGVLPPPLDGLLRMLGVSGLIGLNAIGSGRLVLSLGGGWASIERAD